MQYILQCLLLNQTRITKLEPYLVILDRVERTFNNIHLLTYFLESDPLSSNIYIILFVVSLYSVFNFDTHVLYSKNSYELLKMNIKILFDSFMEIS